MSVSDQKVIEEETTCAVCMRQYEDPKVLICHHVFCKECLEKLAARSQLTASLSCPICRKITNLPNGNNIEDLQSAFFVQPMMKLQESFKLVSRCESHKKEKILFCESCLRTICGECTVHYHSGHKCREVKEVYEESKQRLSSELETTAIALKKIDELTFKLEEREKELVTKQEELISEIDDTVKELQEALETKRASLVSELQKLTASKIASLNKRKTEVNSWQENLQKSIKDGESLLKNPSKEAFLEKHEECLKSIASTYSNCRQADLGPPQEVNIMYVSSDLLQAVKEFASIETFQESPQQCYASGSALNSATVGDPMAITVHIMDHSRQPCENESSHDVEFMIVSELDGKETSGIARSVGGNKCELTYTPTSKGYHHLSIKVRNQHIYGSPFHVPVHAPISTLGMQCLSITRMKNPCGIAISPTGHVLAISESCLNISVLQQNGDLIREIKDICRFSDIAVADDHCIYAVSKFENQVIKLSSDGTVLGITLKYIEEPEVAGPLRFNSPMGIAYSSKNKRVYVSNTNYHEVQILNEDLTFVGRFGTEGIAKAQFKFPTGICCSKRGVVFVADSGNDRIQKFSAVGEFLKTFGKSGKQEGRLGRPLGVAVDRSEYVYVSEEKNDRVSIFDHKGKFVKWFGHDGGILKQPSGIAVDSDCGTVLVCNSGYNLIQLY